MSKDKYKLPLKKEVELWKKHFCEEIKDSSFKNLLEVEQKLKEMLKLLERKRRMKTPTKLSEALVKINDRSWETKKKWQIKNTGIDRLHKLKRLIEDEIRNRDSN